jgi:hypothetical protein
MICKKQLIHLWKRKKKLGKFCNDFKILCYGYREFNSVRCVKAITFSQIKLRKNYIKSRRFFLNGKFRILITSNIISYRRTL